MNSFAEFLKTVCVEDFGEDSAKLSDTDIIKITSEIISTPKTPNFIKNRFHSIILSMIEEDPENEDECSIYEIDKPEEIPEERSISEFINIRKFLNSITNASQVKPEDRRCETVIDTISKLPTLKDDKCNYSVKDKSKLKMCLKFAEMMEFYSHEDINSKKVIMSKSAHSSPLNKHREAKNHRI